jgi:AraC-like DNA-binding protein
LSRFVLLQRLASVHRMLTDSRHAGSSIGALAYGAGFGDLSTFNREFRRCYGATPSDVLTVRSLHWRQSVRLQCYFRCSDEPVSMPAAPAPRQKP